MENNKHEHDETNFEEMLEASLNRSDDFTVGDSVTGTIVQIDDDTVFVDISGKSEAVMDIAEFRDKNNNLEVNIGDSIEAFIVSTSHGEIQLTRTMGRGKINQELLSTAYAEHLPVHGTVTGVVKGGYAVSLSGIRCFCPFSQIDIKSPENPEDLINQSFEFAIIEYKENGKNIILSRRNLLESIIKEQEVKLKESLNTGDIVSGPVSSIQKFGIFVDLGGIEALVPRSELSLSRLVPPDDFKEGDTVSAMVKSIDWKEKRITLSIKDMSSNPWDTVSRYKPGDTVTGKVTNLIKSGAFIEIEPGLEGLLHISRMNLVQKVSRPEDIVSVGDTIEVIINDIKPAERKMSLDMAHHGKDPWSEQADDFSEDHTGTIETIKPQGINVRLSNGMLGFIPRGELASADIEKNYSIGSEIQTSLVRMERDQKNLILSEKKFIERAEKKDYNRFIEKHASEGGSTLGALFKDKFNELQKNIEKK